MPHVVIEGPVSLEIFFQSFKSISIRRDESILKVKDALCNRAKTKILLECIAMEDKISQSFYVAVTQKGGKTSIHLDALTDPEKNDSIKRLLAIIAQQIKAQNASCSYGQHNLHGFFAGIAGERSFS